MPHRSIKDVLIFSSVPKDTPHLRIFYFVFPWDTNAQSGTICKCIRAEENDKTKEVVIDLGGWCQPISNPFLGERISYVESDMSDESAHQLKLALFNYNRVEQPYRKLPI